MPREMTPMDQLAGLPLPMVPTEQRYNPDWHHHFHPKRSSDLADLGGHAVRNVRLQHVDRNRHDDYHNAYFGPVLPTTDQDRFGTIIMAAAGYVPEQGIAFKRHRPSVVMLSETQRKQLQFGGDMRMGSVDAVRAFMRQYVLEQPLGSINVHELTLEEFVTTPNPDRRLLIGHNILAQITDLATESVSETYWQANRRQLLLPGLPSNVQRFTKTRLGNRRNRNVLVRQLHAKLAA